MGHTGVRGVDVNFILLCEQILTTEKANIYQIPGYKIINQSRTTTQCIYQMILISKNDLIYI